MDLTPKCTEENNQVLDQIYAENAAFDLVSPRERTMIIRYLKTLFPAKEISDQELSFGVAIPTDDNDDNYFIMVISKSYSYNDKLSATILDVQPIALDTYLELVSMGQYVYFKNTKNEKV